jgi:hypothetical protein
MSLRLLSSYKADLDYAAEYHEGDSGATTSFAAMAVSRDGMNLFTPPLLAEIRQRMEETENTTIEYDGNVFSWDDICSVNSESLNNSMLFACKLKLADTTCLPFVA